MTLQRLKGDVGNRTVRRVPMGLAAAGIAARAGLGLGLALLYQRLPDIAQLTDYRP